MPVTPVQFTALCPKEQVVRSFLSMDTNGVLYTCSGCEWQFTVSTQAPTDTTNGAITAGVTTAIPVAAGGASFTQYMNLLLDTEPLAEVVVAGSGATGTSIPVPGGFAKSHLTAVPVGQILLTPANAAADVIPHAPGWGF